MLQLLWFLLVGLALAGGSDDPSPITVTYDQRSFFLNGSRTLLIGGCVHYPRSSPMDWPRILKDTKMADINLIEVYVFWNLHQPNGPNDWYFQGNANIWQFLQECQNAGLFVHLRIGPYVCAEWNLGGIPVWVKDIPNIVFRDYDLPWLSAMKAFVTRFVSEALKRGIFSHQGGPVIMTQIENEYGNVQYAYKNPREYVAWAVQLAQNLTNIEPWVMCVQDDAPVVPNLINTCNGFYCDNWLPTHFSTRDTPAAWTENWPGWFQNWGAPKPHRPVEDVAFSVARWFSRGGSFMTYYMWHGGTTWARKTGGPMFVTSYDYDAPMDEYGYPHDPKYSHLKEMHSVLRQYEKVLLSNPIDDGKEIAPKVYLNVYGTIGSPNCVAFLGNVGDHDTPVSWNGNNYLVHSWSVMILGGCSSEITFDTSVVTSNRKIKNYAPNIVADIKNWGWWFDVAGIWDPQSAIKSPFPLEQVVTTHDTTDYLWYSVSLPSQTSPGVHTIEVQAQDIAFFYVENNFIKMIVSDGNQSQLSFFLPAGASRLNILTQTVGLRNFGTHYEQISKGISTPIFFDGIDISTPRGGWIHQIGVKGESLQIFQNPSQFSWHFSPNQGINQPLTWWYAKFPTPPGTDSLAFDFSGLGKGFAYVNGYGLGRYWNITAAGNCPSCVDIFKICDYRGSYAPGKCVCDCGLPSQRYYHVPRDWLKFNGEPNELVLFEEIGVGDLSKVALVSFS